MTASPTTRARTRTRRASPADPVWNPMSDYRYMADPAPCIVEGRRRPRRE